MTDELLGPQIGNSGGRVVVDGPGETTTRGTSIPTPLPNTQESFLSELLTRQEGVTESPDEPGELTGEGVVDGPAD